MLGLCAPLQAAACCAISLGMSCPPSQHLLPCSSAALLDIWVTCLVSLDCVALGSVFFMSFCL